MEALHDPDANHTYTAVMRVQKQSVIDAKRLLSAGLVQFGKAMYSKLSMFVSYWSGDEHVMRGD